MKFSIGDRISCNVEIRPNNKKYILTRDPQPDCRFNNDTFEVIARSYRTKTYTVLVPPEYVGWTIDEFKVRENKALAPYKGKRFWEVHESYVV